MLLSLDQPERLWVPALPDSSRKPPLSGFGVDTLRLRGPATDELMELLPEKRFNQMVDADTGELYDAQRGGAMAVPVGRAVARVTADYRRARPEVAIEFSAPSVLNGHNAQPLMVELAADVAEVVHDAVSAELPGLAPFQRFWLNRLDVDREFSGVRSIPLTLQAVSFHRVARATTDRLARGTDGLYQSLTRGNARRWLAVAYDKGRQLADQAERTWDHERRQRLRMVAAETGNLLRFELQLRGARLRDFGIRRIADVEEGTIYRMAQQHFDRARFGELLAGGTARLSQALTGLTPAQQRNVLVILGSDLIGLQVPMSHNVESESRRLARRLSLTAEDLVGVHEDELRRLDFEAGVELVGEAAITRSCPPAVSS